MLTLTALRYPSAETAYCEFTENPEVSLAMVVPVRNNWCCCIGSFVLGWWRKDRLDWALNHTRHYGQLCEMGRVKCDLHVVLETI